MGDYRHDRIRQRAYEIWQREGSAHGNHEKHWLRATDEVSSDEEEHSPSAVKEIDFVPGTILGVDLAGPVPTPSQAGKRGSGTLASSDVMTVEALAMRTGITGDQAQELIDRLGSIA